MSASPAKSGLAQRKGSHSNGDIVKLLVKPDASASLPSTTTEPPISWRMLPALGYLCTGTCLAVMGQLVNDQGASHPSTQLIAWTKYLCTFVLSLAVQLLSGRPGKRDSSSGSSGSTGRSGNSGNSSAIAAGSAPVTADGTARKAAWLTVAVGVLDTVSYGLNCLGFALCGSSLSMVVFAACGQVFTAVTRRVLLRKTMTSGQILGVCIVAAGLVVRSAPKLRDALAASAGSAGPRAAADSNSSSAATAVLAALAADRGTAAGVGLIALSALGYSFLGCLYEWLSAVRGPAMSHVQVATTTSLIGLLATTAFQLVYTRPRWQALVVERMAAKGLEWGPVVRLYGVFGALFTVHGLVQGVVLQRSGATAVGIVSALRASAVAVASGVLFCRPEAPQQCLTPASSASAAIVTGGALLWTLTGPRKLALQPAAVVAGGQAAEAKAKAN